jgi:hypothetical protein
MEGKVGSLDSARLWVVCPSYFDTESFAILRARVLEVIHAVDTTSWDLRFVVVDDTAGRDDMVGTLRDFADVTVITPPFNLGHQRGIVYGLRKSLANIADSDFIVTMDADGEDRPEDLPLLLEPIHASPDEYRTVSVALRSERSETLKFRVLYVLFRLMFRTLTGTTVRSGNFAAYQGWQARRMLQHPYFDLCYSSTLISLDLPVVMVPCPRGSRYAGRSRMNMFRLLMHGVRMLMPFTDRIAVRALTAFSSLFGLGLILAFVVVGIRIFTTAAIPGWTTFTVLGVLILSFVALGNFVVLFAVFSHSRGISLASLEEWDDQSSRNAPATSD